ncbi:hypothetical protein ScPMuIL_010211 [Solemya velum]
MFYRNMWDLVEEEPCGTNNGPLQFLTCSLPEVQKAVQTAQGLYQRWKELLVDPGSVSKEEYDWTTNELRNSLRSIEWDLEDLEETVDILYCFKIEECELLERRGFINKTKNTVRDMKEHLSSPKTKGKEESNIRESLLKGNGGSRAPDRYTRLDMEMERSNQRFLDDTQQQQQSLIKSQDDQLDNIGNTVGTLKNMSHQIGSELDDHTVMLDEFRHEMDTTESRLDSTMKKMAKVFHMSNDKRQWCAIMLLLVILVVVIVLFFVL